MEEKKESMRTLLTPILTTKDSCHLCAIYCLYRYKSSQVTYICITRYIHISIISKATVDEALLTSAGV